MLTISAINYILVVILIAILLLGIFLIHRHQAKSIYRRFLSTMLIFWALIMLAMIIHFRVEGMRFTINGGVANMQIILLGLPCFFSLISFPAVVLNAKLTKVKNWVLLSSPMIVALIIYFTYHLLSGDDPLAQYSPKELLERITSVSIILRFGVILLFISYCVGMSMAIWDIVPLYNRYVKENYANSSYNVDWVRSIIIYIAIVTVTYFLMALTNSYYTVTLYIISVIALFGYIVDRSLFYKTIEDLPPLKIKWHPKEGWHMYEEPNVKSISNDNIDIITIGIAIDNWMEKTQKYTAIDFSIDDVMSEFKHLTQADVTTLFKSRGETFQSYVRRYRIELACEIMKHNQDNIYIKQLFNIVGFSHYSSFSRAFVAVTKLSPSQYLNNIREGEE